MRHFASGVWIHPGVWCSRTWLEWQDGLNPSPA